MQLSAAQLSNWLLEALPEAPSVDKADRCFRLFDLKSLRVGSLEQSGSPPLFGSLAEWFDAQRALYATGARGGGGSCSRARARAGPRRADGCRGRKSWPLSASTYVSEPSPAPRPALARPSPGGAGRGAPHRWPGSRRRKKNI